MCLIGEIIDPYYQKRNFDSLFNRPKRSCLFQHLQAGEKFRKKAYPPTLVLLIQIASYIANEESKKNLFLSKSPIIQRLSQLLVGDPGVLDGIGRLGVA